MKPRILFFIETGGPGGAEKVVLELLRGFKALDCEVFLSTLRTGWLTDHAQAEKFPYHQIVSEGKFDLRLPLKLATLCKKHHIDILHTHLLDSNFYGALAAKLCGVVHLGTEHGDIHHIDPKKFLRLKLKIATSGKSLLTSVSDYSAGRLLELGVAKNKVRVVPNPLPEVDENLVSERESFRNQMGVADPNCWLWVHVGNIRPVKDQTTLIKGFVESVKSGAPNQLLIIIGDGPLRKTLEQLAQDLGEKEKIMFAGHRDDVSRFLNASDGFILSSLSESMPMALLEAIAHNLLPLCSNVGGIPEIVPAGNIFHAGDSSRLAELCTTTALNPEQKKSEAIEIANRIRISRSLDAVLTNYGKLWEELSTGKLLLSGVK